MVYGAWFQASCSQPEPCLGCFEFVSSLVEWTWDVTKIQCADLMNVDGTCFEPGGLLRDFQDSSGENAPT